MTDEPRDRGSRDPKSPERSATKTSGSAGESRRNIGPYRILQKLGEGGMGEVYEAWSKPEKATDWRAKLPAG